MDRRTFLGATGITALGTMLPRLALAIEPQGPAAEQEAFEWNTPELTFSYALSGQHLRQKAVRPRALQGAVAAIDSAGVETAIQCSGEDSPDSGMKQGSGAPGVRLVYKGKREEATAHGHRLILSQVDAALGLEVESFYESFDGIPVVRRWTRVSNAGSTPVGIEFVSSAMLHSLADGQNYEHEVLIHLAFNSWMSEAQWHTLRPSELGFVENARTSWSQASAGSIGTWSTEKYLPMAMVENTRLGLIWFWQIEHNGSWYWEISNNSLQNNRANDVYAYLGGPDDLHSAAWKKLSPGQSYQTVPVALGCVQSGFGGAVDALTRYRRAACLRPRKANVRCSVIFNDYMNCLWGDPSEAKELPIIAAAAKVGCEYFVIDAGWYAELNEDWSRTIGSWEPTATRWPHGLKQVMGKIIEAGMIPGLWLEPEVAGVNSTLGAKPDSWFLMRHGKRVLKNARYLLDFRNPEVRTYLDAVVARMVDDYGAGYIKMDYNVDSLQGTDLNADSVGQGLMEHNRAYLGWVDRILDRHPDLVLENCGSGGGRMDYAQLSHFQLQSVTDQEEYVKMPAILTGASAAVLPEQAAMWSYPTADSDPAKASFNMVTGMMCRMHQSGRLDQISSEALQQVRTGIEIYKSTLREHISQALPFYPLGMPDVTNLNAPVALGMRAPALNWIAVWRLDGPSTVAIPHSAKKARVLYPADLGIEVKANEQGLTIEFPRPRMACILAVG